jgi:hypothetical protein
MNTDPKPVESSKFKAENGTQSRNNYRRQCQPGQWVLLSLCFLDFHPRESVCLPAGGHPWLEIRF